MKGAHFKRKPKKFLPVTSSDTSTLYAGTYLYDKEFKCGVQLGNSVSGQLYFKRRVTYEPHVKAQAQSRDKGSKESKI